MSGWSEGDFLEAMMPVLRKKQGPDWCPDAETLGAVVEGNVSDTLSQAVAAHAAQCPACANLIERLRSFDQSDAYLQEPEWNLTEKRLDNWLESFLASDAAVRAEDQRVRHSGLRRRWQRLTEPLGALQIRWLLVPAATLPLMIFSFLVGRVSVREVPQTIAQTVPRKEVAEATTPPTALNEPQQPQHSQTAPKARPPRAQPNRIASGGPQSSRSAAASVPTARRDAGTETAVVTTPPTSTSLVTPVISSTPELPQPTEASASPAPTSTTARGDATTQAAQIPGPATSAIPGRPVNRGTVQAALSSGVRAVAAASRSDATTIPDAKTQQPAAISAPAQVRLEAGTRVWISLKSVRQRADGGSDFSGVALLPVTQSGSTLLVQNTQISGTVSVRQGKTTVQIMELVSNGVRYRLKGTGGEANTGSGTGTAVKFDAGKVLETWMVSASAFEKLPEEVRPAESTLRNEDIIKLAKVGINDALILAKIGSSKCQFDTSTDALIQLKQSGVSDAVLKAMVGATK